jgi:hypothetical protein
MFWMCARRPLPTCRTRPCAIPMGITSVRAFCMHATKTGAGCCRGASSWRGTHTGPAGARCCRCCASGACRCWRAPMWLRCAPGWVRGCGGVHALMGTSAIPQSLQWRSAVHHDAFALKCPAPAPPQPPHRLAHSSGAAPRAPGVSLAPCQLARVPGPGRRAAAWQRGAGAV